VIQVRQQRGAISYMSGASEAMKGIHGMPQQGRR